MKSLKILPFLFLLLFVLQCSNTETPQSSSTNINTTLIPFPEKLEASGQFSNISNIEIADLTPAINQFIPWLKTWPIPAQKAKTAEKANLNIEEKQSLNGGAYTLSIAKDNIAIQHKDPEGLMNALSTVYQLLAINDNKLPVLEITDQRPFQYRGMHLDVSRHMFPVADIKRYIDYHAFYKLNYFHWHLTDDQGWRIEIKKYPKLQEIAAYRDSTLVGHYNDQPHKFDGKKYGGFYTQKEIKEVVAYAHARGIEVIPEIDIPGHCAALIDAYPELGCTGKDVTVPRGIWGVFFNILCPKEETFQFLSNVFDEVIALFPSQYVHIGGDECPKDQWKTSAFCQKLMKKEGLKDEHELQSYFIKRVEKMINAKGKKIIGWDEILEGGLAPNATIMSWRGIEGGIEAAQLGHPAIMAPSTHCYFDYYQSENPEEPLAIGSFIPYEKVYDWKPIPEELPDSLHRYIMGGQGCIWTEYMKDFETVEYMVLVRMATLAEVLWGKNSSDIAAFTEALSSHIAYWKKEKVNIADHLLFIQAKVELESGKGVYATLKVPREGAEIYIKRPSDEAVSIFKEDKLWFKDVGNYELYAELKGQKGKTRIINFQPHKGTAATKIAIKNNPAAKFSGNGAQSVFNGIKGFDNRYGGSEWLGFDGDDFDATLDFDKPQDIQSLSIKLFKGEGQWIYLPSKIEVYNITDKGKRQLLAETNKIESDDKIANITIPAPGTGVSKLNIVIKNFGPIPAGRQGGGNAAWLMVDEIEIK